MEVTSVMRRLLPLALALLMLSGCMLQYEGESVSLAEHKDPYAFRETTQPPTEATEPDPIRTASDYYSLREALYQFIFAGVEHGEVVIKDYTGSIETDIDKIKDYFMNQDAISAYAVDYLELDRVYSGGAWRVRMDAIYRRSAGEIAAIESVLGIDAALKRMTSALVEQENSFTLRVSGYAEEDFAAALRQYVFEHPDQIAEAPDITADVYPNRGYVRVVEVHYVYRSNHDALRRMRTEANAVLDSACAYFRYSTEPDQTVRLMYYYLNSRFHYVQKDDASVYTLLCEGESNSFTMSSVLSYLCNQAEIPCYPVEGLKDGEPWYWNVIEFEDGFRHVDFQTQALSEGSVRFLTDDEMEGYEWDRDSVPACTLAAEDETEG